MSVAGLRAQPGRPEDLPALLQLERLTDSHPWTAQQFGRPLRGGGECVWLLRGPDADGGPAPIHAYSVVQVVADELHVHKLAVHPARRRSGLGRMLLEHVLRWGQSRGARKAQLEVRRENRPARRLYRRLGFHEVGARPGYYSLPPDDAVLLSRPLPP